MEQPSLTITFEAPSVSSETLQEFDAAAKLCHQLFTKMAVEAGMPKLIELILTDTFDETVCKKMRKKDYETNFSSERPFGHVAAKNLSQDDSHDHVIIVFNACDWSREMSCTGNGKLFQLALVAHELAHPYLTRMRLASGAAKGVAYPSVTPTETARSLTRIIIDEYYADYLAALIVNTTCTKTTNGVSSPAHVWDVIGDTSLESLKRHISEAGKFFPNHVNRYRTRQIPLAEMWGQIQVATEHLFVMYIHARALADATGEALLILDSPEIKQLPFMQKYVTDSTFTFLERFRKHRPLLSVDSWREMEEDVVPAGELAFKGIWNRLGLKFEETAPQQPFRIIVSEPS